LQRERKPSEIAGDRLLLVANLSSHLVTASSLEQGVYEILFGAIELLGGDKGDVQLYDPTRRVLTIAAHYGFERQFLELFREVSVNDPSSCGRALMTGERVVIEDVYSDPLFTPLRAIARAAGFAAVTSTPLISSYNNPLGMISVHFRFYHRPSEESLRIFDIYVRQAVAFLERCQVEELAGQAREDS
jgi:GAF domain-containing protein